jgi:hypothetical protein
VSAVEGVTGIRGRANLVIALLAANIIWGVAAIVATLGELDILQRVRDGGSVTMAEGVASDHRVNTVGVVGSVLVLTCGVAWLVWQHRGQRNLSRLGVRHLVFTPGWAVGWWFVPIANLWKPFQSVRELWRTSRREVDDAFWAGERTWILIGWWWAMLLVSNVVYRISYLLRKTPDLDQYIASDRVRLVREVCWMVTGVLAVAIVRRITGRQEEKIALGIVPPPRPDTQKGWRP